MEIKYVSHKVAKLAKEKGFNVDTVQYYTPEGNITESEDYDTERLAESNWNNGEGSYPTKAQDVCCSAPTQELLKKWLREVHNIHIRLDLPWIKNGWVAEAFSTESADSLFVIRSYWFTMSFEEALEKALFEALKRITYEIEKD